MKNFRRSLLAGTALAILFLLLAGNSAQAQPVAGGCPFNAGPCLVQAAGGTTSTSLANYTSRLTGAVSVLEKGAVCDGTTDDTTAINAAIAQAMAPASGQTGGTVLFPNRKCLMLTAMIIPYTGTSPPVQSPLRLTSLGNPTRNTGLSGATETGATLDMRYNAGGTQVAKIDTRGFGYLEIDHLNIIDGATDNALFIQTTNTTVNIHDNTFIGNTACLHTTCQQDVIRLGGITSASSTLGTDVATDGFQGYGSKIDNNEFDYIREAVQFGGSANGIPVVNNWISTHAGSSKTDGAPFYFYGVGLGAGGNTIGHNTVEITGYPYGVTLAGSVANSLNSFVQNGFYDESVTTLGVYNIAAASVYNLFEPGFVDATLDAVLMNGTTATQTWINMEGKGSQLAGPVTISNCAAGCTSQLLVSALGVAISSNPPNHAFEFSDGTGARVMYLNGGNTTTNGAAIYFGYNSETSRSQIGNCSMLFGTSPCGGSFDSRLAIQAFDGLVFGTNNAIAGTVDKQTHWLLGNSTAPTIASGACGATTNGTIASGSNDQAGQIQIGSASTAACTVSFAGTWAPVARACTFSAANAAATAVTVLPYISSISTTAFVLTGAILASTNWYYHCY